jgi:hypothetical protein
VWIEPLEIQRWRQMLELRWMRDATRAQMARTSLAIQENELSDWRGAWGAMRCYEILSVKKLERRAVARDLMRSRDQIIRRKREGRCMQDLAKVASRLGSLRVMVKERDAGNDVQEHYATKNRERLARELRREKPRW